MTTTTEIDPASWLELLPEEVGDAAYRADVRAECASRSRHANLQAAISELEGQVRAGLTDPSVDLVDLAVPASRLAAAKAVAGVLPPVAAVEHARHQRVAAQLPLPPAAALLLPPPPAFAAEVAHHNMVHAPLGELPPIPTDVDPHAISVYEQVSAQVANEWSTLNLFRGGLQPNSPMASHVQAWHATVNDPTWQETIEALGELRELIARVDALRAHARGPHVCRFGDVALMRLQTPTPGTAWNYEQAVRDGVLVLTTPSMHVVTI